MNDADRLSLDPVMRWNVGGHAVTKQAASTSQMGRFETELLAADANVEALADMNGVWIDRVYDRHPPTKIVLDMNSSVNPTHGDQEGTAFNGLQSPRQSGAVHQGRQVRDQMDTAVMWQVWRSARLRVQQRRPAPASRPGLQFG